MQAEELLRKRGLWEKIDHIILAQEGDEESEGMRLSKKHGIEVAPFFLVQTPQQTRVYTRVLEFIKKELSSSPEKQSHQFQPQEAQNRYSQLSPSEILAEAQKAFGSKLALSFSGAEDVVLIDMAVKNNLPFSVFSLDTGRLHGETYEFIDKVRQHYGISIEIFSPNHEHLSQFVTQKGLMSFYEDGHQECCQIRKVEPLQRALAQKEAWITGLRRDQSPSTRNHLLYLEEDHAHPGVSQPFLWKFNPLLDWGAQRVWDYIRFEKVPYNALHDQGYQSIGCQPCTRPSRPGEHEREARWWWEKSGQRECGLHIQK